jgi:conjugative transposon protein TcpC
LSAEQNAFAEGGRVNSASVAIATHPMWRLQLARRVSRYVLYATCIAGLLASARFAVDPPRAGRPAIVAPAPPPTDSAAEGYATLFARRYLTWEASQPQLSEQSLAPMTGATLAQGAGIVLPSSGAQHVLWAEVVQARTERTGAHVYTVAAQTDTAGLLYLTVGVARETDGSLAIAGYPAFVGAPQSGPAQGPAQAPEVSDRALAAVVERGLRNYLAAAPEELAADLSSHAPVAVPELGLTLESVQRLSWSSAARSVLAVVQAHDARGVRYTLGYELDVADVEGRWEISAIQMDSRE